MNPTIARLTWRSLLGRRRAVLLMVLPVILLVLAVVFRAVQGTDPDSAVFLLGTFGVGFLIPLLGLIAGTGAIGPEIDDGSIVYVLAKPLNRYTIAVTKLAVAVFVMIAFGVLPILVAGFVLAGGADHLAIGYAAGTLVAGVAYSAVFLLLAVITRNAVVIGLIYALVWESTVGNFVPGAQALSVQQWGMAVTEKIVGASAENLNATSPVDLGTAVVLLVILIVGATAYAGHRLRSIRLAGDE